MPINVEDLNASQQSDFRAALGLTDAAIGDASALTSGLLPVDRLPSEAARTDQNNSFYGTSHTMPEQTAEGGASVMTRELVDAVLFGVSQHRTRIMPVTTTGWTAITNTAGTSLVSTPSVATVFAGTTSGTGMLVSTGQLKSGQLFLTYSESGAFTEGSSTAWSRKLGLAFDIACYNATDWNGLVALFFSQGQLGTTLGRGLEAHGFGVRMSCPSNGVFEFRLVASKDTNTTISGATNASPIVITQTGHGFLTGHTVEVRNVLGNTAANGIRTVTKLTDDTYSLDGSTGNGAFSTSADSTGNRVSGVLKTINSATFGARIGLVVLGGSLSLYMQTSAANAPELLGTISDALPIADDFSSQGGKSFHTWVVGGATSASRPAISMSNIVATITA